MKFPSASAVLHVYMLNYDCRHGKDEPTNLFSVFLNGSLCSIDIRDPATAVKREFCHDPEKKWVIFIAKCANLVTNKCAVWSTVSVPIQIAFFYLLASLLSNYMSN